MDEKKILFSIIIPAYNEEAVLPDCLKAVKEQKGGLEYETIVVDNDSEDKTSAVARSLGARVIVEKKQGVGSARKAGTDSARGEYVLHVDADTRLPSDYLLNVKKRFDENKKLVCLGGQMYYYDASWWKNILRFFVHWGLWFFAVFVSFGRVGPMGNNMTFKKEVYDKTRGFNGDLKYGEDMDLCRSFSKFGKVRLDMSLKCHVSIRRFMFNKKLFVYFLNFLKMSVLGKPYKNILPHSKDS